MREKSESLGDTVSTYKKVNIVAFSLLVIATCLSFFLLSEDIRSFLIVSAEKFLAHRPLTHEIWHERFLSFQHLFMLILLFTMGIKAFTCAFVTRTNNSFINLVRFLACMMIYFFHAAHFTASRGTPLFTNIYIKFLQTPAWGGVWIFFVLAGYLSGKGFSDRRYEFNRTSITTYYANKFFKIVIPTFSFIFIACVFVCPTFFREDSTVLIRLLTFTYNGRPGGKGIGACWYVFSLVPLYLLAPLFSLAAEKIAQKKRYLICVSAIVLVLGFLYRYVAMKLEADWWARIYTPFYANIDLFFGGILINQFARLQSPNTHSRLTKDFALFTLLALVLINTVFSDRLFFYLVYCPSLYVLALGFCLVAYSDEVWTNSYSNFFEKALSWFAGISFEFYLFQTLILDTILPAFDDQNVFILHVKMLVSGCILSIIAAIGFKRIFRGAKK